MRLNDLVKNLLLWVVILVVLTSVFQSFSSRNGGAQPPLNYSDFLQQVRDDNVDTVNIEGQNIRGTLKNNTRFTTYSPETDNNPLITLLVEHNVRIVGEPPKETPVIIQLLFNAFPILLLGIVLDFGWKRRRSSARVSVDHVSSKDADQS